MARVGGLIEPHYPTAGNGRQAVGLSIMLRVYFLQLYFLQQWFNLSDPGAEDGMYESPVLRRFAGVDLGRAAAPMRPGSFVFAACWRRMSCVARSWIR